MREKFQVRENKVDMDAMEGERLKKRETIRIQCPGVAQKAVYHSDINVMELDFPPLVSGARKQLKNVHPPTSVHSAHTPSVEVNFQRVLACALKPFP